MPFAALPSILGWPYQTCPAGVLISPGPTNYLAWPGLFLEQTTNGLAWHYETHREKRGCLGQPRTWKRAEIIFVREMKESLGPRTVALSPLLLLLPCRVACSSHFSGALIFWFCSASGRRWQEPGRHQEARWHGILPLFRAVAGGISIIFKASTDSSLWARLLALVMPTLRFCASAWA